MKKRRIWLFVPLTLIAVVLAVWAWPRLDSVSAQRRQEAAAPRSLATRGQALSTQNVWQRPPVPDDPVRREVRLQGEPDIMETSSEAVSATLPMMGFTEEEGTKIRQAFVVYKAGCLRVIRGPGAFRSGADPTEATLPWNAYHRQLREILGEERAGRFEAEYQARRLIVARNRRVGNR